MAADVNFMAVVKGQTFEQSGPSLVTLKEQQSSYDNPPLSFEGFVEGAAFDSLVSGTLQVPGGSTFPLTRSHMGDSGLSNDFTCDSLIDLDATRPNGTYTLNFVTQNDGTKSISLALTGDTYPNVPQVTNFAALQSITTTAATTVTWSPMTGGTSGDFIMCSVWDQETDTTVFETGAPGAPGALDGTAVQAIMPADTLVAGRSYGMEVLFVKVIDTNISYSHAISGYYKAVNLEIKPAIQSGVELGAQFDFSIPQAWQYDVPRDSAVSFHFTKPMMLDRNPIDWKINGTNIPNTDFTYEWINNQVLLCKYNSTFPADAEISWQLNLSGFKDAADFALYASQSGSFHTSSNAPTSPPDVSRCYLRKMREFRQIATTPVSTGMYGAEIEIEMAAYNRVKAASLTVNANGRSGPFVTDDWDPQMWLDAMYASKSDFDQFYANGDFTFGMTTLADGPRSVTLSLGASDDYPEAPTVTNLAALQAITPGAPVTLTWNPPANWNNNGTLGTTIIQAEIENSQGDTVAYVDFQNVTSSSQVVIPADVLWPGRTYQVQLYFTKIKDVDDTSYPGAIGLGGFGSVTGFTIQTSGKPNMPTLALERSGDNMNLNLTGGETQRNYVIEASTDLQRWLPLEQRWLDGSPSSFYDNDAQFLKQRYYRLRDAAANESVQRHVTIHGTVWTNSSHTTPVIGAVIGTSLDSRTTTTDSSGRFFLETDTSQQNYDGSPYNITMQAGASFKIFGPSWWGSQPRILTLEQN